MEIPTVKIELYHQNRVEFAQQLGRALATRKVFQIDGFDQAKLDELYRRADSLLDICRHIFKEGKHLPSEYRCERIRNNNQKNYQQTLVMTDTIIGDQHFKFLATAVEDNFTEIYQKIAEGLNLYLKDSKGISRRNRKTMIIARYNPGQEQNCPTLSEGEEVILVEEHIDGREITLTPTATKPGLEGFINCEWIRLNPEPGHLLVFKGTIPYENKIKSLKHRVRVFSPFREARTAAVYG